MGDKLFQLSFQFPRRSMSRLPLSRLFLRFLFKPCQLFTDAFLCRYFGMFFMWLPSFFDGRHFFFPVFQFLFIFHYQIP